MATKWESARHRAESLGGDAKQRWQQAGERHSSVGLAEAFYERDKAAFGSVLGSAIALRLFLFLVPLNVAVVGLANLVRLQTLVNHQLSQSNNTGAIATALDGQGWWQSLSAFGTGTVLAVWAGRSLGKVLSTSSASSWALSIRPKAQLKGLLGMTAVFFAIVVSGSVFARLRDEGGFAVGLVAWVFVMATVTLAWFMVNLTLPRSTTDPGALLPGTALFGVCYTVLQWFMQFYLPGKIERTSDTLGQLATTVAQLGNFFFVGRLMSVSFVFSAVVFEQHGSVSQLVFSLPVLRTLPKRSQRLRRYFALEAATDPLLEGSPQEGESPSDKGENTGPSTERQ
jgi:hypothetical protein